MKETIEFKNGNTKLEVEFDPEELTRYKEKIISEMSIVDHYMTESPEESYYSPKYPSIKRRKDIQIRNYREWSRPWIDVWDLYCSSYDRYVIPHIARLIDDILNGKPEDTSKAIDDIKELRCGKEYIPIHQTVKEYTSIIAKYKEYHATYPYSPLCHKAEAKVAEENINKYISILLDDEYAEKFRVYYETVSQMILVRKSEEEQIVIQEHTELKRMLVPNKK